MCIYIYVYIYIYIQLKEVKLVDCELNPKKIEPALEFTVSDVYVSSGLLDK